MSLVNTVDTDWLDSLPVALVATPFKAQIVC